MAYPVYYVEEDDTLPILFDTFDGGDGSSITMTGLATTDIEIYKDGSATTRASDNGYTLLDTDGIDFSSITGVHGFSVDLSDNSDAGFFAVGSWYHVVVSSVTVDSQTVNFVAAAFRIVSATRGLAGTALPDAAADAAGGIPISDAGALDLDGVLSGNTPQTGDNYARLGSPAGASIAADLLTIDNLVDDLETRLSAVRAGYLDNLNGHTAQTGDNFARLGSPAGASVSADIAAVKTETNSLDGTKIPDTLSLANINAEIDTALGTTTYAELSAVPAATSTLADKINWLFALARNKITQTSTTLTLRNDADGADIATSTVSDDGTTATRGEFS